MIKFTLVANKRTIWINAKKIVAVTFRDLNKQVYCSIWTDSNEDNCFVVNEDIETVLERIESAYSKFF